MLTTAGGVLFAKGLKAELNGLKPTMSITRLSEITLEKPSTPGERPGCPPRCPIRGGSCLDWSVGLA